MRLRVDIIAFKKEGKSLKRIALFSGISLALLIPLAIVTYFIIENAHVRGQVIRFYGISILVFNATAYLSLLIKKPYYNVGQISLGFKNIKIEKGELKKEYNIENIKSIELFVDGYSGEMNFSPNLGPSKSGIANIIKISTIDNETEVHQMYIKDYEQYKWLNYIVKYWRKNGIKVSLKH